MTLRTPSKIRKTMYHSHFIVRFVTHGGAIRYSNIIKNLNRKSVALPRDFRTVTNIGFTSFDDLMDYPHINEGSMFNLIQSLPSPLIKEMKEKGAIIQGNDAFMKEGVVLTLFVYKIS